MTGLGMVSGRASEESTRLLLAADVAGEDGAGEDADRERGQQRKGRGEAVAADAVEEIAWGLLRCVHR